MPRWQYQGRAEPVSTNPESVRVDKFAPVYETVMRPRRILLVAIVAGSCFLGDIPRAEAANLVKWQPRYPDRVDRARRIQPLQGVVPPYVPASAETVTLDKWTPTYPVRIDGRRRVAETVFVSNPLVNAPGSLLDWIPEVPDGRLDRAKRPFWEGIWVTCPACLTLPETSRPDKWLPTYPDRIARLTRPQPDSSILPPYIVTGGGVTVSDNFNRADGGLGSNWILTNAGDTFQIVSNQVTTTNVGNSGDRGIYWDPAATAVPADQFSQVTGAALGDYGGVAVRANGNNYYALFGLNGASANLYLDRVDGGTRTNLASWAHTAVAGEVIRLEVSGSSPTVLTVKVNGSTIGTYSDNSGSQKTAGQPGLSAYWTSTNSTTRLDDWSGGSLGAAVETVTSDKWAPVYPVRLDRAARILWAGWFAVDPYQLTQPEAVSLNRFAAVYPDRIDRARRIQPLEGTIPPYVPAAVETITPDKWAPTFPDRIDRARRIIPVEFRADALEIVTPDKWFPIYPVRLDPARRAFWQGAWVICPACLTQPEAVTFDRWAPVYPDRLVRAARIMPLDWGTADAWLGHVPIPPVAGPLRLLILMGVGS